MNRYNEGKIYKLCNDVDDQIYVGYTCLSLPKRHYSHKKSAKHRTSPVYNHLNEIGWDHVHIILIESYPCANKMELEKRERYWIETLNSSLNRYIPQRTNDECKKTRKINNDKYKLTEKYREFVKRYRQTDRCQKMRKKYEQSENCRNRTKERRQTDKYKAYQKEYQAKRRLTQKYQKTLSFMESTIQKYQAVPPIEIINFKLA